jgi:glutamate dehydrogenase/leucine dehydrogenase
MVTFAPLIERIMWDSLKKFESRPPEIVFEWHDQETEAKGWIVINSLRGGAAGGGTRMRKGLDKHEVMSLAKTMEVKFTVAGPPIGGAKSGIDFDPSDPRKRGVLERWFKAVTPILKNYYGTGGDLNVDEIHDVIDITSRYGLLHPQEGVVIGHLGADKETTSRKIQRLKDGVEYPVTDPSLTPGNNTRFTVADLITGYGVAQSVIHHYNVQGLHVRGKKVMVQGWGNVGGAAGLYLAKEGAEIIAIIDRDGGVINENGFTPDEVTEMFLNRKGNALNAQGMLSPQEMNQRVWNCNAQVFIPAAASRLVTRDQVDAMIDAGLEVIACGANVPFDDPEIFFGPTGTHADDKVAVLADFISNCGMARVFAYLIAGDGPVNDTAIFKDVSDVILQAIRDIHDKNPKQTNMAQTAFEIAMEKLDSTHGEFTGVPEQNIS